MHPDYDDIISRISEKPSWWQEGGVPRYGDFDPDKSSSIYAKTVILAEIACQGCGEKFRVCFTEHRHDFFKKTTLEEDVQNGNLHYGDPPNTGCCAAGATMSSEMVQVLEFWRRGHPEYVSGGVITDLTKYNEWRRDPLLEGPIA